MADDETFTGDLVDTSDMDWYQVRDLPDTVIARALRGILDSDQAEPSLGFSARI